MRLRISLVNYLNAAPLGWYFLHGPMRHEFQVVPSTPAKCAEQLATGQVDIGLIPSIEYQRIPGLLAIPGIAIAAANEVRSVLMVRSSSSKTIQSVALDTSSATSVALIKLLLQFRMGLKPEYVAHEPVVSEMLRICDAALIIGDAALRCSPEEYEILDLAAAWHEWQNLPFVFAFWACREGVVLRQDLVEIFQSAKEWGLARIEEIALSYSHTLHLPVSFLEHYLRHNLDHNMGPEHEQGLQRFYDLAFKAGMIRHPVPVRFLGNTRSLQILH